MCWPRTQMSTLYSKPLQFHHSSARCQSNVFVRLIFVRLIFAIVWDRKNFLPWIFIPGKFVHVKNSQTMVSLTCNCCCWFLATACTVKCLYFVGYIFRELACKMWFVKVIFVILELCICGMARTADFRWINFAIEMKIAKSAKFTARKI